MSFSNPQAPASHPQYARSDKASSTAGMSNSDFRAIMTPRVGDSKRSNETAEEAAKRNKANKRKWKRKEKIAAEGAGEEPATEDDNYRDRAQERREGKALDYEIVDAEGMKVVEKDGVFISTEDRKKQIEESKYLGGDEEHTHLVKGLDFALMNKKKEEMDKAAAARSSSDVKSKSAYTEAGSEMTGKQLENASPMAKSILLAIQTSSESLNKITAIQNRLNHKTEHFLPGRSTYFFDLDLELGSDLPTRVMKSRADQQDEEADVGKVDLLILERLTKVMQELRAEKRKGKKKKKQAKESRKTVKEDDIFGNVGEYELELPEPKSNVPEKDEDMPMVTVAREEDSYFKISSKTEEEEENKAREKALEAQQDQIMRIQKEQEQRDDYQQNKNSGKAVQGIISKNKTSKELDPSFVSDHYSEAYPGAYEQTDYDVMEGSDDEDVTKMDMGGTKKNRLRRWDFASEEAWSSYNENKEAVPKAAFQFGVKMSGGRKTKKNSAKQKMKNDMKKINNIILDKYGKDFEDENQSKKRRII